MAVHELQRQSPGRPFLPAFVPAASPAATSDGAWTSGLLKPHLKQRSLLAKTLLAHDGHAQSPGRTLVGVLGLSLLPPAVATGVVLPPRPPPVTRRELPLSAVDGRDGDSGAPSLAASPSGRFMLHL